MEITVRPGKYPTTWRIDPNTDGWSREARDIWRGAGRQAGKLIGDIVYSSGMATETEDDIIAILNARTSVVTSRIEHGGPYIRIPDEGIRTNRDALDALNDLMSASLWVLGSAFESLRLNNNAQAVRGLQMAANFHGLYSAFMEQLRAESEAPPSGPGHALANRDDQKLKPVWLAHCRALQESGTQIRTILDLLEVDSCNSEFGTIKHPTLRKWASQGLGIKFQAGRRRNIK
jgi:hypothetical protein